MFYTLSPQIMDNEGKHWNIDGVDMNYTEIYKKYKKFAQTLRCATSAIKNDGIDNLSNEDVLRNDGQVVHMHFTMSTGKAPERIAIMEELVNQYREQIA